MHHETRHSRGIGCRRARAASGCVHNHEHAIDNSEPSPEVSASDIIASDVIAAAAVIARGSRQGHVSGSYARQSGEDPGELDARLTGASAYPDASGRSEYDQEGSFRELDVFLTGAGGLAGQHVTVFVAGHQVGTMAVSSGGQACGEWDTEHGQNVPSVSAGSHVQVKTG